MLIQRPPAIAGSEITARAVFENRRRLIAGAGLGLAGGALLWRGPGSARAANRPAGFEALRPSALSSTEALTARQAATSYNNYYEFGTGKEDPARNAQRLETQPWTLQVEGLAGKPRRFDFDELLRLAPLEERIYRLRCVEGWSMVIPWVGFALAALLKEVEPQGSAKFVQFLTHYDPEIMTRRRILHWPYAEGLRMDEALHPLTILAVGMYGEVLPAQNGAPVRLVVPWKYGFKSAKSITTIRLLERKPPTGWNMAAPHEYGFYSNVNPEVAHPRWSQATERRIGETRKRPTLMFNGYAEEVARLYQGMNLSKDF